MNLRINKYKLSENK